MDTIEFDGVDALRGSQIVTGLAAPENGFIAIPDAPGLGMDVPEDALATVRAGMFAVVNEAGGTAPHARLGLPGMQLAGKTGSSQVRRVSRWAREHGHFNSARLTWEFSPHALFICFAPYDAPRYAVAVVVEHGNAGADVAAPLARDIMRDTILRDPARRVVAPGQVAVAQ